MKILGLKTVANKLPESQLSKMAFDRHSSSINSMSRGKESVGRFSETVQSKATKFTKLSTEGDQNLKSPFKKGLPTTIGLLKSTPSKEAHCKQQ